MTWFRSREVMHHAITHHIWDMDTSRRGRKPSGCYLPRFPEGFWFCTPQTPNTETCCLWSDGENPTVDRNHPYGQKAKLIVKKTWSKYSQWQSFSERKPVPCTNGFIFWNKSVPFLEWAQRFCAPEALLGLCDSPGYKTSTCYSKKCECERLRSSTQVSALVCNIDFQRARRHTSTSELLLILV